VAVSKALSFEIVEMRGNVYLPIKITNGIPLTPSFWRYRR